MYKTNHRYNTKIPVIVSIRSEHQSTPSTTTAINRQSSGTVAAAIVDNHQPMKASYHGQINHILEQWRQLQQEKKQYQQEQVRFLDLDRIMEEDLEHQLKELERKEEEQYKRMEQTIAEQINQNNYNEEQIDDFEQNCLAQLEQIVRFEEEEQKQQTDDVQLKELKEWDPLEQRHDVKQVAKYGQSHKKQSLNNNEWLHRAQQKDINLRTSKQKQIMYLKLAMLKNKPAKTKKIIDLLKEYCEAKKCYIQIMKRMKN